METPTILVIDDEQAIRDACCRVYRKSGYLVDTANDGTSGLEKMRNLNPDIVLVDLKMPGLSGMEVLEEIRETDPTIVSIVITGYATVESAVEAMKRGAYDFLPKPFTPDALRLITKRGLERRQLVQESLALRREKERMRELFISMVSHQLRSPLTAVQGYLRLLSGGFVSGAGDKDGMIQRALDRLDGLVALIGDWLRMAEIDKERLQERFEPLDLVSVLSESIDSMQTAAREKAIGLEFVAPERPSPIQGDKSVLREVFINLIDNGIKYNRIGGAIRIRIQEDDHWFRIEFSDTGFGISSADLPFVFDEFFRVKDEKRREIKGTGLGLSIVRRMVEAHSGSVTATSELGKGSAFTVTLPKSKMQSTETLSRGETNECQKEDSHR